MPTLARRLGLTALILYGIGDILGAGIYALVGKVVHTAGQGAWVSFLVSAALAAVTGLTYAELSSRIPKSGGAAAYSAHAFKHPIMPFFVGLLVLASGVTSAATVSLALYGYLQVFFPVPQIPVAVVFIFLISCVSFWGIRESVRANNIMTIIEFLGLILVVIVGFVFASQKSGEELAKAVLPTKNLGFILSGALLAFYAFIGFEDTVNLAEESKNPTRDIPRAILTAVAVSTVLYILVVLAVLWSMSAQEAGASGTPLLDVLTKAGFPLPPWGFAAIALIAISNTGLANLIMSSRLLYGMADQGLLPRSLKAIHPKRRTPWAAIAAAFVVCVLLVLTGGVSVMAQTTSFLLIMVFIVLHASLIIIRKNEPVKEGVFRVPNCVPYIGIAISLVLALHVDPWAYFRAGIVLAVGGILYFGVFKNPHPKLTN